MKRPDPTDPLFDFEARDEYVRTLARRLTRDDAAARDIAQETWLRVWSRGGLSLSSPRAWFRRTVRQITISNYRSESARRDRECIGFDPRPVSSPRETLEALQLRHRIAQVLQRLSPPQREVVHLRYYEDLPPREIAARLGVPTDTVNTRLKRALAALRAHLSEEREERGGSPRRALLPWLRLARSGSVGWSMLLRAAVLCLLAGWALIALAGGSGPTMVAPDTAPSGALLSAIEGRSQPEDEASTRTALAAELPSRDPRRAELRLTLLEQGTRMPLRHEAFELHPLASEGAESLALTTDAEGRARLELEGGLWRFEAGRGPARPIALPAASTTVLELALPRGVTITGLVRGANGQPLPGARLLLTRPLRDDRPGRSLSADASGAFRIEGVDPRSWLAASAEGMLDGDLVYLDDPAWEGAETRSFSLVLEPAAAPARGLVRDRAGRPIEDARIRPVAAWTDMQWRLPSRRLIQPSTLQEPRTSDAWGALDLSDLKPYPWQLVVEAQGHAPSRVLLEYGAELEARAEVEIVLDAGRTLRGSARLPDGSPAIGARVRIDAGAGLDPFETQTDGRGEFAIEGLPRLDLEGLVQAQSEEGSFVARASFALALGDRCSWEAVLGPGGSLSGRLARPSGEPARGLWISLGSARRRIEDWIPNENPAQRRWTSTDDDGRFAFELVEPVAQRLDVWEEGADGLCLLDSLDDLALDGSEILHVLPAERGLIRGTFLGDSGVGRPGAQLWIEHPAWSHARRVPTEPETGRYRLTELSRGEYTLFDWQPGKSPRRVRLVKLEPGEEIELQPIVTVPEGAIEVALPAALAGSHAGFDLSLHERTARGSMRPRPVARARLESGEARALLDGLPPGEYVLTVGGDRRALESFPLRVESGRATPLAPELPAAASGAIDVRLPLDWSGPARVHLELYDQEERLRVLTQLRADPQTLDSSGLHIPVELPPGHYRALVHLVGTSRRASAELAVEGLASGRSFARIEL